MPQTLEAFTVYIGDAEAAMDQSLQGPFLWSDLADLNVEHHPGYMSWEEYTENQRQLEANVAWTGGEGSGAAKSGTALLSGLLRCGHCGRKLQVGYSGRGGRVPRYACLGDRGDRGSRACLTVGSLRLDRAVVDKVLEAIRPIGIEAALRMSEHPQAADDEKRKALELALERARYEANRARRQFDAVEPENRLVASELEDRWNSALARVAELEARLTDMGEQSVSVKRTPSCKRVGPIALLRHDEALKEGVNEVAKAGFRAGT